MTSVIRPGQATALTAVRITPVTTPGCDIIGTWDASTTMTSAPARLAIDSTTSGTGRLVPGRHDRPRRQLLPGRRAGLLANAAAETGRCDRAITAACASGRSAANASRNRSTSIDSSPITSAPDPAG